MKRLAHLLCASVAAVILVAVPIDLQWAGASGVTLDRVKCTTLPGDPLIEAPGYAQEKGANGLTDGWWCQLPHATEVPSGLVARRRFFIPANNTTYGDYWTWYGPPSKGRATRTAAPTPTIEGVVVADFVYAEATAPKRLVHQPAVKGGKRVELEPGLWGTESVTKTTVQFTFRFPTNGKGVPKYLTSVATVTVIGWKESFATVLAVARQVRPL
jgi:hypothetical protein